MKDFYVILLAGFALGLIVGVQIPGVYREYKEIKKEERRLNKNKGD
ncbi:hypothetical protein KAR91_26190 [Candidatus Pacearchaeota archaeon]|nr:hypothetical protein [Candidatus Pacearchaeota archaeon]